MLTYLSTAEVLTKADRHNFNFLSRKIIEVGIVITYLYFNSLLYNPHQPRLENLQARLLNKNNS